MFAEMAPSLNWKELGQSSSDRDLQFKISNDKKSIRKSDNRGIERHGFDSRPHREDQRSYQSSNTNHFSLFNRTRTGATGI